ncbi:MAG: hypothetical protein U0836_27870 [Pirellulales bacterium]
MPHRLRRATRFGLRSAVVVLSLLGALLAFYANRVHRDRAAVAMIDRLGGTFRERDPVILIQEEDGDTIRDQRTWQPRLKAKFRSVLPWQIVEVGLGGPRPPKPPDGRGVHVPWRARLGSPARELAASGIPVRFPDWQAHTRATDADVARLRGLPLVEYLDLSYTDVTDAIIDDLCSLPRLRLVRLEETRLTPNGLSELRRRRPDCIVSLKDSL